MTDNKIFVSNFYFVDLLHKVPFPILFWSCLIIAINFFSSYRVFLGIEPVSTMDYLRFYIGNTICSILSVILIILSYNKSILAVNCWVAKNRFINEGINSERELRLSQNIFFKHPLFIVIIIVLARIALAQIFISNTVVLGDIIIDTICIFSISSLVVTLICINFYLYTVASIGIKVEYFFEIRSKYKELEPIITFNTIIVGIYLIIFCFLVAIWSYQYKLYTIGIIINFLIIMTIFAIFILGLVGIHHGIANTKANMADKAKSYLDKFTSRCTPLFESNEISFHELSPAIITLNYFINTYKCIEDINEWIFDIGSIAKIFFLSIVPTTISLFNIVRHV